MPNLYAYGYFTTDELSIPPRVILHWYPVKLNVTIFYTPRWFENLKRRSQGVSFLIFAKVSLRV